MFEDQKFRKYDFSKIPLSHDLFLMDEKWMRRQEKAWLRMLEGDDVSNVGAIGYISVNARSKSSLDISWYPNFLQRLHRVQVSLPYNQFVACVDVPDFDEKPHVFVKSAWMDALYLRAYSIFALIDAIDMKEALKAGTVSRAKLMKLRSRIDKIASKYPTISLISFADNILIKTNWYVGKFDTTIRYTYNPEIVIKCIGDIRQAYQDVLGMNVYCILTQGSNEYYNDALLHISETRNHISLNSLGVPFAQLWELDKAAKKAIRDKKHKPAEFYIDSDLYYSLQWINSPRKGKKYSYKSPMLTKKGGYFLYEYSALLKSLISKS